MSVAAYRLLREYADKIAALPDRARAVVDCFPPGEREAVTLALLDQYLAIMTATMREVADLHAPINESTEGATP